MASLDRGKGMVVDRDLFDDGFHGGSNHGPHIQSLVNA